MGNAIAYGSKYEKDLDGVEIARRIRMDIKAGIKAGKLPKGLKASVRTRKSSLHEAIDVVIKAAPGVTVSNPERVAFQAANPMSRCELPRHTDAARALLATVEAIVGAYNFDGSDLQSDYHNVNFYGSVEFAWGL